MDRLSDVNSKGTLVELIPRRIMKAKGNHERSRGLNTKHGEDSGTEERATSKKEKVVGSARAAEATW